MISNKFWELCFTDIKQSKEQRKKGILELRYDLLIIAPPKVVELTLSMHQDNDPYNDSFYMMDDDEDNAGDLWDEYYNKRVLGKDDTEKAPQKVKSTADKQKYPHVCPHCGSASWNNIFTGKVECSKCNGKGECKCDKGKSGGCGGKCSH